MRFEHLALAAVAWIVLGVLLARAIAERRRRNLVVERLNALIEPPIAKQQGPETLLKRDSFASLGKLVSLSGLWRRIDLFLAQGGFSGKRNAFLAIECLLAALPLLVAYVLGVDQTVCLVLSMMGLAFPPALLVVRRIFIRRKFQEQLPNAIDLMVAVLRSGHSLPTAVKSVSEEIPRPCGSEFQEVLARMNLGQPMSEALVYSTEKYSSYELDLIRRAVAIQAEVGGSLAELLEKTNVTLRQRIKLARHIKVLTAQSRLTAIIVGVMPFVVATGLNFIHPGYLDPLLKSSLGHILLLVAFVLQAMGIAIMTRLSTVKV